MLSETVIEWTKKWKQEGLDEGIEKGRRAGLLETARRMLQAGMAKEAILELTGLKPEDLDLLG